MGRPRKNRRDLPRHVYYKHSAFYFVDRHNKWHRLGATYADAMVAYANLMAAEARTTTMGNVLDRYQREIVPTKARATRKNNLRELGLLRKAFGQMRPDDIKPQDVYRYMDARKAPVAAKREKSLLSHVFSWAIQWGEATDNPCRLVRSRYTEKPRERYVTDEEFAAVYEIAPEVIKLAMELALMTGLRQGDILGIKLTDFTENGLEVRTGKTGKRMIYEWTPELKSVLEGAKKLREKEKVRGVYLLVGRQGQRYTPDGFRAMWQRVQRKAMEQDLIDKRFTFHDLRAKAASDSEDERLLGHADAQTIRRHYKRKALRVTPIKPRVLDNP